MHLQLFSEIITHDDRTSKLENEEEGAILTFVKFEEDDDIWGTNMLPMLVREANEGVRSPEEVRWYAAALEVRQIGNLMV